MCAPLNLLLWTFEAMFGRTWSTNGEWLLTSEGVVIKMNFIFSVGE